MQWTTTMTPEKRVKDAIKKYLTGIGAWYYMPVPNGFAGRSIDFFVCFQGKFYGIEAKAEDVSKATKRQEDTLNDIATAGGGVCVENRTDCYNVKTMLGML